MLCGVNQCRGSEVKDHEREKERDDMTLCMYECLRAVGLQHHYARFTSVGVRCAAHLSGLTMEDYPILGIRSMEDRTRLFHLIRMVKTIDLESLEYEDGNDDYDDYDADGGDEGYAVEDRSFTYDSCRDPAEDVYDDEDKKGATAASFSKTPRVRRQLDFSCEAIHHHYNCPHVHSHQSDHHTGANTKPDIMEGISMYNSHTRFSPKCVSSHKTKPRPAKVASKKFSTNPVRKGISRKEKPFTEIGSNRASERKAKPTPVYESKRAAGYNYGLPLSSPPAPNKKQLGEQRISVCVRKRPLTRTENRRGEADVVTTPSGECVIVHESKEAVDLVEYILQHKFFFDQVFGEESSNEEVYRRTTYPLVQHMLNGGKATCFAYGQTGAGKTHTMLGSSPGRPGLYALAVRDIFAHLSTTHTHSPLQVYVSFFEIYCGQLYDLLDHRKRLFAREDGQKVVHITGLRDVSVDSVSSLLEVILQGTEERTQGMSGVNPLSSRSHALLQIQLRGSNQQIAGRMWFVDLAGSERASDTKEPDRQSRMEGAEINQSLLALKECIRSLDQEQSHTPFRQSKLTQVLKDSFVGDSMTCMIANISPGHLATEHTLNTLRYADRVKELRGQGGLRGERRGKKIPSPKRNLSNSSSSGGSSIGIRGKSPPKKPKLGRQRDVFGSTTPTTRLDTGGAILCSTPKNSRWGEETSARNDIGLEQITPIRGWLGRGDKMEGRERAGGREGRRRERYGESDSAGHSNVGAGLVLGQATDERFHLWEVQRQSGFNYREKENQQSTLKGGRENKGCQVEKKSQVDSSRDARIEVERLRETDLRKVDEKGKERENHLRHYHQQLQQFMPSSASSSANLFSPSTHLSLSSSNQASLSSSVSPSSCSSLHPSSRLSVSALTHHDFGEVLDAYSARVAVRADGNTGQMPFFPSREICLQTETSPSYNKNKEEVGLGDSGGIGQDGSLSWDGTRAKFGQDRGKRERRRSLKATGEGEVRVRRDDWRPAGMEGGGETRWAWVTATEAVQAERMTVAMTADVEAQVSYNCDSEERRDVGEERLHASNVPAVWSTDKREGADGYGLVSTRSYNDSNSLFNYPPVEPPHQRAPAERPLSPACEHANTLLTPNKLSELSLKTKHTRCTSNIQPLPLQNTQQGVPSSSCREKEPWFAANTNRRQFSNAQPLPLTVPTTQNGCKIPAEPHNILSENPAYAQVHNHPEVKDKMSVLPQEETSADSLSYNMDPLSISLLQVDQQVATASFLQGQQNNTSLCLLENKRGDNTRKQQKASPTCAQMVGNVKEDVEFPLSLLELPQAATHCPLTSDTMKAANHKDMCCATYEHCGIGMMKPSIPVVMLVSLWDQKNNQKPQTIPAVEANKALSSPLKPFMCAPMQTYVMQSISSSVQHSGKSRTPSSHNLVTNGAIQLPSEYAHTGHNKAFPISTPQSESVFGQFNTWPKQCHTVHSHHTSNSDISIQPKGSIESNNQESTGNQQIRPIIQLSTLEDLDHDQCHVVQAHWKQLQEMEALCQKEGMLLCHRPDMAFVEYVHKLEEILERKALCVHSMIAQLQPYLKPSDSNQQRNQRQDIDYPIT